MILNRIVITVDRPKATGKAELSCNNVQQKDLFTNSLHDFTRDNDILIDTIYCTQTVISVRDNHFAI